MIRDSTPDAGHASLFESVAETAWVSALLGPLAYPQTHIRAEDGEVEVFRDSRACKPFVLILAREGVSTSDELASAAHDRGFEYAVAGTPDAPSVIRVGHYSSEWTAVAGVPSWIPGLRRRGQIARSVPLLTFESEDALRIAFRSCHDAIWKEMAKDPAASFDLLSLVLAAKLRDETGIDGSYEFCRTSSESAIECASRLRRLLADAHGWLAEGNGGDLVALPERLSASLTHALVGALQDYSLLSTAQHARGTDLLGIAYEMLVGSTFRGELGSYFTPRSVADFIVRMLDLRSGLILDPACGSAGLLLAACRLSQSSEVSKEPLHCVGNDLNPRMVRTARLNFALQDAGATILSGDGLDLPRMTRAANSERDSDGFWWRPTAEGPYDGVVANPPFAGHEQDPSVLAHIETAQRESGSVRSLNRSLPFLEGIVGALRFGGVAGVVIPTSVLNAEEESFVRFRDLLLQRVELIALIGLPERAFVHTDCGIHGALLFFRRVEEPRRDYDVFVGWADHLGYDRLGRPSPKSDFEALLAAYRGAWPTENTFPVSFLRDAGRLDPAWLRVARSLPDVGGAGFVPLTDLVTVRDRRFSRRELQEHAEYQFFEVGDADLATGAVTAIRRAAGWELQRKSRIKLRVCGGDILLPNHRDSLIAKGSPTGRSAVLVPAYADGAMTTDRFIALEAKIEPAVVLAVLNSSGVRRQLVAACRGAASLDVREKTLSAVRVPKALLEQSLRNDIVERVEAIAELRKRSEEQQRALQGLLEDAFEDDGDFRPPAWGAL